MQAATSFEKEVKNLCLSMAEEKQSTIINAFLGKYVERPKYRKAGLSCE